MIAVAGDTDRAIQCLISVVFHQDFIIENILYVFHHAHKAQVLEHTMVHYLKK